jgi:hypothetical protein
MLVALGLISALGTFTQEWAVYGFYTLNTDLPVAGFAAWITNWVWIIIFGLALLTAALFPDGRFPSRLWGWFVYIPWLLFVLPTLIGAMIETPLTSAFQLPNPFVKNNPKALYDFVFTIGVAAMPSTAVAVLVTAVVRFRRSQARERQQMKWLLFGVAIMAFLTVGGLGINFFLGSNFGALMVNAATIGPALGVGIALLRHQLYDIDILIRRTLQYTLLTSILALLYFGLVVVFQGLFSTISNQQSEIFIVITTLAIAALFNPLRRRVQDFIDRRFYRK